MLADPFMIDIRWVAYTWLPSQRKRKVLSQSR